MADTLRVLYVDDEPELLEIGKVFLEESGDFSVTIIGSAPAALDLLIKEQFDAIISDYQMPILDGIQFLIEVRAKIGSIPFILFTGRGREEVVIQAINSGADFYLQKGGDPGAQFAELVHKVKSAVERKSAEKKLRESERVHETMISNLPGFVYRCANDPDWTMYYISDGCQEITGYAPDELLNNTFPTYNDLVHPEFQKKLWDNVQNFLEKREVIEAEYPVITKTGETRWVWERGRGIFSDDGRLLFLEGFITDITGRKVAEAYRDQQLLFMKALNKISEVIISNDNSEDILECANRIIGKTLQLDRALIYDVSFEKNHIYALCEWLKQGHPDIEPTKGEYPLDMFLSPFTEIKRTQKYLESHSNAVNKHFIHDGSGKILHEHFKIKSLIWYPFAFDEHGYYVFTLNQILEQRQWTPEDIAFLESAAKQISLALIKIKLLEERKRVEDAFLESEARYRTIVENIPQKIFIKGRDSRYVSINENFARDLGILPDEIVGRSDADLFPAELAAIYHANDVKVLETGQTEEFDERYLLEGEETWVHTIKTVVRDNTGEIVGLLGVFWDITDRKRAQEELIRKSEELAVTGEELQYQLDALAENERALHESEAQKIAILNGITTNIAFVDRDLKILWANKVAAESVNKKPSDMVGHTCHSFWADPARPCEDCPTLRAFETKRSEHIIMQTPDGRVWDERGEPVFDETGNLIGVVEIAEDITERKRAEEALRESEEKYRILLDESLDPVFSFYPDGTYRYVNRAFATGVGKPVDQITGKKIWEVFDKEEAEKRFSSLRMVFATGNEKVIEVRVPHPGGDRYYVTTIVPVKDENGSVVSAICSSKDITPRKQAEEALRQANKKLNLLSGITRHDINNQLLALNGFLKLLQNKAHDPTLEDYFTRITRSSDRISTMIQFTREYEEIGVHVPAWQEARTLVDLAAKDAPLGKIMVKNNLPAGFEVFADPLVIKVFYNLMDNAARYGGKITTIGFSILESGEVHLIVCEDDGEGIPADEKEKIFERGFGKTTGMGLALSREILDITGITIKETGEPGKGARFEMTVPAGMWRKTGKSKEDNL